jgi:hypothetical protein
MSKRISLLAAALLIFSAVSFVAAQQTTTTTVTTPTKVTETVQHPDGTYTVIEYPVGKETIVNLDPVTITGGKGLATILRDNTGTRIKLNLTGVPSDVTGLNLFAVDPAGMVTSLGPITVTNGTGTFSATTPLDRFMLIASPESTLTTYDPNTKIFFRSTVPSGFTVIPHTTTPVAVTSTTTPVTGVTQTVNSDGTFSVIEWPTGREINVDLTPVAMAGGKGVATILRDDNGTRIKLNLSGVPSDVTALNLYAVDPTGAITSLGPVTVTNGTGTFTTTTPLNRFMLIGAPDAGLTTYDPNTKVFFRNAVPEGLAVIPATTMPVGEKVGATAVSTSPYTVPMLNIPAYEKGDDTKIKVNFSGALTGARANVFITPKKGGAAKVKMRFHELKEAPAGKVFTVWAVSPDNQFSKVGQVVNTGGKNEAQIESEVAFPDFGLMLTMEDASATIVTPAGPAIGIVEIVR